MELVVLGVPEADSRQGTMLRYAHALKLGIPARLTTGTGHDQRFDAVTDVVEHAAEHPAITAVTIVRRDGSAVLREELPLASPRAGGALRAERSRPYTADEARRLLALHHGLRNALPQHPEELREIAALARPLLPAHMQARLTMPDPVPWPLPWPQPETGYSPLSIKRPNEISYYIAYCPADTTLDELIRVAGSRWAIEECFQTAKQECGLNDYPGPPIPRLAPPHHPVHGRRLPDRPISARSTAPTRPCGRRRPGEGGGPQEQMPALSGVPTEPFDSAVRE